MAAAVREVVREEVRSALAEMRPAANENDDRLVDVEEAARRLGLAASTVYKRAAQCELPNVKIGGRLLFKLADLAAYADARRRSPERVRELASVQRGAHNVIQNDSNDDGPEADPDCVAAERK